MADYPTRFSFQLTDLTAAERAWLAALLTVDARNGEVEADSPLGRLLVDPECLGFDFEFDDNDHSLWIHDGGGGIPEDAAAVVREFLRAHRPAAAVGFEWANTCTAPRIDSFGGGAVFITADESEWMASSHWLGQKLGAATAAAVIADVQGPQ